MKSYVTEYMDITYNEFIFLLRGSCGGLGDQQALLGGVCKQLHPSPGPVLGSSAQATD